METQIWKEIESVVLLVAILTVRIPDLHSFEYGSVDFPFAFSMCIPLFFLYCQVLHLLRKLVPCGGIRLQRCHNSQISLTLGYQLGSCLVDPSSQCVLRPSKYEFTLVFHSFI